MSNIVEATKGKIRDWPISQALRVVLIQAADDASIDTVLVTSGGQCSSCSKRTGSHRHDNGNAADLQLVVAGTALDFTSAQDLPTIERFVTAAARYGATGIGAAVGYMGPKTLHVGFGSRAVWGAGGEAAGAPDWLKDACRKGWSGPDVAPEYTVVARDGVRLRAGAGPEYNFLNTLPAGTKLFVLGVDGPGQQWARVDLQGDGLVDGHVNLPYLEELSKDTLADSDDQEVEDDYELRE